MMRVRATVNLPPSHPKGRQIPAGEIIMVDISDPAIEPLYRAGYLVEVPPVEPPTPTPSKGREDAIGSSGDKPKPRARRERKNHG